MYSFGDFKNELDYISLNLRNNDIFSERILEQKCDNYMNKKMMVPTNNDKLIDFNYFGILNKQNCCYVNSTLQALFNCKCFVESLNKYSIRNSGSSAVMELLTKFQSEIKLSQISVSNNGDYIRPLLKGIEVVNPCLDLVKLLKFTQNRSEDAEEFLTKLISTIHEDMLKCSFNEIHLQNNSNEENGWVEIGKGGKSVANPREDGGEMLTETIMSEWLSGKIVEIVYKSKNKRNSTSTPFFILPLTIQSHSVKDVESAIINFTQPEKSDSFVKRQTLISKLPKKLILQLKRFTYTKNVGVEKVSKHVSIDRNLQIPKNCLHVEAIGKDTAYKLDAVIFHIGPNAHSGHYTVGIFDKATSKWIYIDDTQLYMISGDKSIIWLLDSNVNKPPAHLLDVDLSTSTTNCFSDNSNITNGTRVPYLLFYSKIDSISEWN